MEVVHQLGVIDRFLWLWILLAMAFGLLLGYYVPVASEWLNSSQIDGVSLPIFVGLLWMMYPILCKVHYEELSKLLDHSVLTTFAYSCFINWVVGPLLMTALAWATLPDLPGYRVGVIMVGLARCIAMVLIWNLLAGGNQELCAMLVALNSLLQILLFSPYSYLFVNVLGGSEVEVHVNMWTVAKSVLIFLGIPLATAILTRFSIRSVFKQETWYDEKLLPVLGPTALLGLLFTIVAMFTLQGGHVISEISSVFRVAIPLLLYFTLMFFTTFFVSVKFLHFPYSTTVTQSFTAASNNFELAIAVSIGIWGIESEEALATVIGPLVEVPVLLVLVYISQFLKTKYYPEEEESLKFESSESTALLPGKTKSK